MPKYAPIADYFVVLRNRFCVAQVRRLSVRAGFPSIQLPPADDQPATKTSTRCCRLRRHMTPNRRRKPTPGPVPQSSFGARHYPPMERAPHQVIAEDWRRHQARAHVKRDLLQWVVEKLICLPRIVQPLYTGRIVSSLQYCNATSTCMSYISRALIYLRRAVPIWT